MKLASLFDRLKSAPAASTSGAYSPVMPPRLAWIEIGVLAALVLAEYFIPGFPALNRYNPHPYWIAVLLLSLQYGTVSGLIAAGISILGSVLIGMPEPEIEERYFNYLIRVWTQPVLWLLVALLLGSFRARQIEQKQELLDQVIDLRARGATLLDHSTKLKGRVARLERHIATDASKDAGALLAALARLSDAEPGHWTTALRNALSIAFPGSQLSLYALDGDRVRHVLTHDTTGGAARMAPEIEPGAPLLAAVVGAGRSVSILDPDDDKALQGHGVAAVPVLVEQQGGGARVIGLIKADRLPPSEIDAATTRRLGVIAAHLAPALMQGRLTAITGSLPPVADAEINPPAVRRWRGLRWLPGGVAPGGASKTKPEASQ